MKIGVIGLGLIGGSIFKRLRELGEYDVVGVSTSVNEENVSKNYETLKDCNLVFVCTPMRVTLDILDKLENYLESDTVVTDVCSLKGFVSHKAYKYCFIPSHPMAGTEHSGWDNSFPELFNGAKWVITPIDGRIDDKQEILENVIEKIGAKVIISSPDEHDKAVALISHMPMVIAQALCANITNNKLAQTLASSGFRDTTRLALSNTQMATDMINMNRENIESAIDSLISNLNSLIDDDYSEKINTIKNFRQNLY